MAYLRGVALVMSAVGMIACGSASKTGDDDDDDDVIDPDAMTPLDCDDNDGDMYGDGPDCLGADCDDGDIDVNPGATEVCNGVDDNCNQQVDEAADEQCYDGPLDTRGVGACVSGVRACIDGALGPCIGQVVPGAEACNGIDDDCDDMTDETSVTLTCGIGECAASTPSCVGGSVTQCTPGAPGSEAGNCTDGLDNDCNGAIDDCTCVHVAPFGNDVVGDGTQVAPLQTINAGIALAGMAGQPKCVYVAAQAGCGFTLYSEDVVMADGISVFGGYDSSTVPWTQRPHRGGTCRTEIRGQSAGGPAVLYDASVTSPTVLDNFMASIVAQAAGSTSSVVRVEGSTGAIISNSSVFGNATGSRTYGIEITEDSGGTPATPTILSTSAEGGAGVVSIAIYSYRSRPVIQTSCSPGQINGSGQCFQGCISGIHIRGNRFFGSGPYPDVAYGVLLEESPGALLDQSVVCAAGNSESIAVKIVGDATGTVLTRSDMTVWRAIDDNGVAVEDCGGAAPWIGDNSRIGAEGNPAGTAIVAAVRATGDCHPLIEANALIVGGLEGGTNETRGVLCNHSSTTGVSSQCNLINNTEVRGSSNNFPASSIGVRCEDGACNVIQGNELIHGRSGVDVIGVQLVGATNAFIDSNQIVGGCGTASSTGILAEDGAARIQNNAIHAGTCNGLAAAGAEFYGIDIRAADGLNELDVHSNLIQGEGTTGGVACTSRGVAFGVLAGAAAPVTPLGILRNNIIEAGNCATRYAVVETDAAADPRFVEHNILRDPATATALYLDENTTPLATAADVDALTDTTASGNLDADPQYSQAGNGFVTIPSGSPAHNAGTATGAPAKDFEGDARPQEAAHDIGPDEHVP